MIKSFFNHEPLVSFEIFWIVIFDKAGHSALFGKKISRTLERSIEEVRDSLNKLKESNMDLFRNINFALDGQSFGKNTADKERV